MFVEPERRLDRADVVLEFEFEKPLRRRFHSKNVSSNAIEQTVEWVQREIRFRVSQGRDRQLNCSAFDVFLIRRAENIVAQLCDRLTSPQRRSITPDTAASFPVQCVVTPSQKRSG